MVDRTAPKSQREKKEHKQKCNKTKHHTIATMFMNTCNLLLRPGKKTLTKKGSLLQSNLRQMSLMSLQNRCLMNARASLSQSPVAAEKKAWMPNQTKRHFAYRSEQHGAGSYQSGAYGESSFQESARAYPYVREVSDLDTDRLLMRQKQYESGDAGNYEAALQYFKELNRQGKHLTVVRLYRKAEIRFKEERIPGKYRD